MVVQNGMDVEDLSGSDSDGGSAAGPFRSSGGPGKKGKRSSSKSPFVSLGLSPSVASAAMKQLGFRLPTPVQRKAIPPLLQGRNVIALARTGSGKTAAFLLPLVDKLQQHSNVVGARGLVVAPSRELVLQIYSVAKKLLRGSSLVACALVGGTDFARQFEALSNNPDIIVATPGRLLQLLQDGVLHLSAVNIAVLDEADRMLELGWGAQLELLWGALPPQRQGAFVSATLPEDLVRFARLGLPDPVFVTLDKEGTLSENLQLRFVFVRPPEKIPALLAILTRLQERGQQALVFVSTRHQANFLHAIASQEKLLTAVIYGAMDQQDRNAQLLSFRKRHILFLLVTDVAARGLDLPQLPAAINFDFPASARLFIHRAGRTARAGSEGCALSLVTAADLPYALDLMTFVGGRISPLSEWQRIEPAGGDAPTLATAIETAAVESSSDSIKPAATAGPVTPSTRAATQGVFPLGAPPALDFFMEAVEKHCSTDSEVQTLQRSAAAAEKLYLKTRPSASRQGCERARELLEQCGGLQTLSATKFTEASLLPLATCQQQLRQQQLSSEEQQKLKELLAVNEKEGVSLEFLQTMRRFRPKVGVQGSVLTAAVVQGIEDKKRNARMLSVAAQQQASAHLSAVGATDTESSDINSSGAEDESEEEGDKHQQGALSSSGEEKQQTTSEPTGGVLSAQHGSAAQGNTQEGKQRVSKRRLQKIAREMGLPTRAAAAAAAAEAAAAASSSASRSADSSFFVDVSSEAKAAGQHVMLHLQQQSMGLLGDEEDDLKRSKTQEKRRWDPKKRKFVVMKVDSSTGLAVKRQRGDDKREAKTSSAARYAQWTKATKKRIQKVGEEEDTQGQRSATFATACKTAAGTSDESALSNKLRFLPLHAKHLGIKEALQTGAKLTHKQARIARKLIAKVTPDSAQQSKRKKGAPTTAGGLRTVEEIAKNRTRQERNKQKNLGKRGGPAAAAAAAQSKAKWMKKQRSKMALKAAPNRSIAIKRNGKRKK